MAVVNIVIADDVEEIHKDLRNTLDSIHYKYKVIQDFYDTGSLKKYLVLMDDDDSFEGLDVLILDHDFGGNGKNGLDALPSIRKIVPYLPIIMLTTFDVDEKFRQARKEYDIDYIQKPVRASDLSWRIEDVIERMIKWELLSKKIEEDKEFMEYLMGQNEELENAVNSDVEKRLPLNMQELIQSIFPDVDFTPSSFRLLVQKNITKSDWNKVFRGLKSIDWKNLDVRRERFKETVKNGIQNLWEYKPSYRCRIFVQIKKDAKPLVVLMDPIHAYSNMSSMKIQTSQ
jgi:DNA-binding response OmpR family regulator